MHISRWVGLAGALLPGLLLAQGEAETAPAKTGAAQQILPQFRAQTDMNETAPAPVAGGRETVREAEATAESESMNSAGAGAEPVRGAGAQVAQSEKGGSNGEAVPGNAAPVVEKLNKVVLEAMRRAGELGYRGRYELLAPVIREVYDFKAISRHVLGAYWKKLGDEQKRQFIQKMTEYGTSEYAAQFDDYDGEQFHILSEAPFRKRYRVVKARLEVPKGEDVEFVYILRQTREGWKIIDVRYDGVSDLALKRGQFAEILESGGFEKLISRLDEKIAEYASGKKES